MQKIIFVYCYPFTLRDYHRYGADYLENAGYPVEIWRVNDGYSKKIKWSVSAGSYQGENMHEFSGFEFLKNVKKNRDAIFIFPEYKKTRYMRAMARYKCNYFLIAGITNILVDEANIPHAQNMKYIKRYTIKYFIWVTRNILAQCRPYLIDAYLAEKYFQRHLPQYVFLGVPVKNKWIDFVPDNKKVCIHAFDYDRYLEAGEAFQNLEGECIVYIDAGFGSLDTDETLGSYKDPWYGKREKIWEKIEAVFEKLEEHYHLPIVVAGHPHTKYADDVLCKRKIIYNKTPELIAKSKFIIMQCSAAMSFALLYKKDILVLIDNDFKKYKMWYVWCLPTYKYFGITPCNMDVQEMTHVPWKYVHKIDEKVAQQYINKYIKFPGTPNKLFIEIMEDKIKELRKEE